MMPAGYPEKPFTSGSPILRLTKSRLIGWLASKERVSSNPFAVVPLLSSQYNAESAGEADRPVATGAVTELPLILTDRHGLIRSKLICTESAPSPGRHSRVSVRL